MPPGSTAPGSATYPTESQIGKYGPRLTAGPFLLLLGQRLADGSRHIAAAHPANDAGLGLQLQKFIQRDLIDLLQSHTGQGAQYL